jgi:hypothetical protein
MIKGMTRTRIAMVVLAGAGSMLAPVSAEAATSSTNGAYAFDWNYGHYLDVCDNKSDNHPVVGRWDEGAHQGTVVNSAGNGSCKTSSYRTVTIKQHQACVNGTFGQSCGSWVPTGY